MYDDMFLMVPEDAVNIENRIGYQLARSYS